MSTHHLLDYVEDNHVEAAYVGAPHRETRLFLQLPTTGQSRFRQVGPGYHPMAANASERDEEAFRARATTEGHPGRVEGSSRVVRVRSRVLVAVAETPVNIPEPSGEAATAATVMGEAGDEAGGAELTAFVSPTRDASDERVSQRDPHCARVEEWRGIQTGCSVSQSGADAYTEAGGEWDEPVLHGQCR